MGQTVPACTEIVKAGNAVRLHSKSEGHSDEPDHE